MQPTKFVPRLSFGSQLLLPLEYYPRIKVPPGMTDIRTPKTVTNTEIESRARQYNLASTGGYLTTIYGLTVTDFSAHFTDFLGQWKRLGPDQWQFQGGDVILESTVTIYLNDMHEKFTRKDELFDMIMSHELEHVRDEEVVITKNLPPLLPRDHVLHRLLISDGTTGQPAKIPDREFRYWFVERRRALGSDWTNFEYWVLDTWADEHNKLARLRDSGPAYKQYKDNIGWLEANKPQYVKWPK